jgi:hypothetical protein
MIYEFDLLIFNILTLYTYYIELIKLDHMKEFPRIYAMESVKLGDYNGSSIINSNDIKDFQLEGNDQIVKSPVVVRIKPINHSNTKMISLELEGPEPFPHTSPSSKNICVIGEPLHVAYI